MATDGAPEETTVSDQGMVTIPANLRRRLDIEAGDKLRWDVDTEGNLSVEIVRQRYGAFEDDDKKAPMGVMVSKHTISPDTKRIPRSRRTPEWRSRSSILIS